MGWMTWLRAHALLLIDRLFGTRLVERELARRQARIERLVGLMDQLNQDLGALAETVGDYQLMQCLLELEARSKRPDLDDWLRFAPQGGDDEALLDSAIECLVKPRLAAISDKAVGPGNYIYHLYPDWAAIIARLQDTSVASELMPWLEEQNHR